MSDDSQSTISLAKDIGLLVTEHCKDRGIAPDDCVAAMITAAAGLAVSMRSEEHSTVNLFTSAFRMSELQLMCAEQQIADDVDALLKRAGSS